MVVRLGAREQAEWVLTHHDQAALQPALIFAVWVITVEIIEKFVDNDSFCVKCQKCLRVYEVGKNQAVRIQIVC